MQSCAGRLREPHCYSCTSASTGKLLNSAPTYVALERTSHALKSKKPCFSTPAYLTLSFPLLSQAAFPGRPGLEVTWHWQAMGPLMLHLGKTLGLCWPLLRNRFEKVGGGVFWVNAEKRGAGDFSWGFRHQLAALKHPLEDLAFFHQMQRAHGRWLNLCFVNDTFLHHL